MRMGGWGSRTLLRFSALALLSLLMLGARVADAAPFEVRYLASAVAGVEAPPAYLLRLDGFLGSDEVTFADDEVFFDVFTDGTALLHGLIHVVEVDDGPPGAHASEWLMNVHFERTEGSPSTLEFFHLVPMGRELVNVADADDFANLFERPANGSKPFRIGFGALPDSKCVTEAPCFSATGWLSWEHGDLTFSGDTADFLMELDLQLQPIPEPGSVLLLGLGMILLGAVAHDRRPAQAVFSPGAPVPMRSSRCPTEPNRRSVV